MYGGAGVAEQIADLKRGTHIVVATPGRMIDIRKSQFECLFSLICTSYDINSIKIHNSGDFQNCLS